MEIDIPQPLADLVLQEAARRELPAEEIVAQALKNYMNKEAHNG